MAPNARPVVRLVNQTATRNLEHYVESARLSPAFGPIPFDEHEWRIDISTPTKPTGSQTGKLVFTQGSTSRNSTKRDASPFAEPFNSFVKAFVRFNEQSRHKSVNYIRKIIATTRILYRASADVDHDPRLMSGSTFTKAEALLKAANKQGEYSDQTANRMGVLLEAIAHTLTETGIASRRIDFRNSVPRSGEMRPLDGEDERMPTDEVLRALFRVSAADLADSDRLLMRLVELLWVGPWRLNEVLRLPLDCEVYRPRTVNGVPVLDDAGAPVMDYGIRHSGSKGALGAVKWIPTSMVSVARRAMAEIRQITSASREVCLWMEANPGRACLQGSWRGTSRDDVLSAKDAAKALNLAHRTSFNAFAKRTGIREIPLRKGLTGFGYRQGDIEDAVLALLKPIAKGDNLKRSEYLFVVPRNYFHETRTSRPSIIDIVSHSDVSDFWVVASADEV